MAFVAGNVVAMTLQATLGTNGAVGPLVQAQPPKFGIVDDASGIDVLWEDGYLATGITSTSLDVIAAVAANTITAYQGKFVQVLNESPEYQGIVVSLYSRQANATGTATEVALIHTNVGVYREVLVANLAVVAGR